ncbi:MAG: hypothetical protein ACKODV_03735, partial [Candidatus Limnocylindrus sp.]
LAACERADAQKAPALPAELAVDGAEIARRIGATPGAWIKGVQASLLISVGRGEIQNQPTALLAEAERIRAANG